MFFRPVIDVVVYVAAAEIAQSRSRRVPDGLAARRDIAKAEARWGCPQRGNWRGNC